MKSNKYKMVIFTIISVIIALVVLYIATRLYKIYINNEILKSDYDQVEVLKDIYEDFYTATNSYGMYNIVLNKSALSNFITKEEFNDKDKIILNDLNTSHDDFSNTYSMSLKYSVKVRYLTLTLKNQNEITVYERNYRLSVNDNKICYSRDGMVDGLSSGLLE